MAKGGKTQTVKQELDPATQAFQQEIYGRALGASNQPYTPYRGQTVAGTSPLSEGAAGQFQDVSQLAGLGAAALGGDSAAFGKFFNPYNQQVIDQVISGFDRQRAGATLAANDAATRAGAFGGSRHGIAEGARLGELDRAQAEQVANLHYQGFNDAQTRALQAANLGLGAANQAFGAGDYFRGIQQQYLTDQENRFNEARDWDLRNLDILKGAISGTPHGSQTAQPLNRNPAAGLLGGAATGAGLGLGPVGIGAGALVGLLGG